MKGGIGRGVGSRKICDTQEIRQKRRCCSDAKCCLDHYDELKDVVRLMSRAITIHDKVSVNAYVER